MKYIENWDSQALEQKTIVLLGKPFDSLYTKGQHGA